MLIGYDLIGFLMEVRVKGDLLVIEFPDLDELHEYLTDRLVRTECYGASIQDYTGFNFSYKTLSKFDVGGRLLRLVKKNNKNCGIRYVIGYVSGDWAVKEHEYRHYRYFSDQGYQKRCQEEFSEHPIIKELRGKGYREFVLIDEAQAHLGCD